MKIIGTGLSGLVGSRIQELLVNQYHFVDCSLDTGIDITRPDHLQRVFVQNPDATAVLHLAAFTDVNQAWEQRGDKNGLCYQVNVIGTKNIANLCAQAGCYLLHISTDFVFDGEKSGGYQETDAPAPIEWYGETKYLAEQEVVQSGAKHAIARIAFPFRSCFSQKIDLVRKIIEDFKNNSLAPLFTDQTITPTFIDDIAAAIHTLIKRKAIGIYHVVGSTSLSPYELALRINKVFKLNNRQIRKASLAEYVRKTGRPRQKNLTLINRRITALGVKMRTIDAALQELKLQLQ